MEHLDNFQTEVLTLDIKGEEYLSLSHYNQHLGDCESNLKRLQQLALNDILLLKLEQIRLQLTRFKQIHERFAKFWEVYKELFEQFRADKLQLIDLELKLYPLFIVPKHPASIISEQFLFDLHDAVMFKQAFLEGFEAQVQNVLNDNKTEFQFTYEQEVTEERKKNLQKQLAKLKTNDEKILFLKTEKANYLQNLPPRTLEVSGSVHANFAPGAELLFDRYIQIEIDKLEGLKQIKSNLKKSGDLKAPAIRLFCSLIHQSTEFIKGSDEDAASYCKRVCKKFNLHYTDNVRKYFNAEAGIKKTDKQLKKVKELILPMIDSKIKSKIEAHITNKTNMFN
jgi:hypothetical protein